MKLRESHMPEQKKWESYFSASSILKRFNLDNFNQPIADIACGYGTFAQSLARSSTKPVYAVDINRDFLDILRKDTIQNIQIVEHDVFYKKLILPEKVNGILLFNILHCEKPAKVLTNILHNLAKDGKVYVIHWRSDIETPGGPPLNIRPQPGDIIKMFKELDFKIEQHFKEISSYHFGLTFQKY